eukprot:PITA_31035
MILEWKWDAISMDFITMLLKIVKQHDSIMIIVDKVTKVAHFVPIMSKFLASDVTWVFIRDVVRIHRVPKNIVSHRDVKFTSKFWKELFVSLGTNLPFSTTYHLQMDEQIERINRILEDMLMMYVMCQQCKWEEYIPLVMFAYNNDIDKEMQVIMKNLKVSHDGKKRYVDKNILFKLLYFGEQVYLCIKPKKSSLQIGSCAKMAAQFCGTFSIIERIGPVEYQLSLPLTMKVHDVFHVSFLKKYVKDVDHVIN